MIGKEAPETAKPVPLTDAAEIVTGAVPIDDMVKGFVDCLFTAELPKVRVVEFTPSTGSTALSCSAIEVEVPLALAVRVANSSTVTAESMAVNATLAVLAGTVTVAGTEIAAALLDRLTVRPPAGAGLFSSNVHASVPAPVIDKLPQVNPLKTAVPVPANATASFGFAEEVLLTKSCPDTGPTVLGVKLTVMVYDSPARSVIGRLLLPMVAKGWPVTSI